MNASNSVPTLPAIGTAAATKWQPPLGANNATSVAALEQQYFKAVSLYRRRNYEKCAEICTKMLETGHHGNVQMFAAVQDADGENETQETCSSIYGRRLQRTAGREALQRGGRLKGNINSNAGNTNNFKMPIWLMEGVWQLKMRALTQRVYMDDLETYDDSDTVNEEVEFERIATAARPGTSIKNFLPRPRTSTAKQNRIQSSSAYSSEGRIKSARPTSALARPGSNVSRPGSSLGNHPGSRCCTASRVRATAAAAYGLGDSTVALYQASRLNPTIYAERHVLVKALFQFLFYHESDVQKAYSLCEAVLDTQKQKSTSVTNSVNPPNPIITGIDWWWNQQMGRCLLALKYPRKAELCLQQSLSTFSHPDTYLLISRLYQRLKLPQKALELINIAVDRHPFDLTFRTEQARIYEVILESNGALQIWRLIAKLNPINIESLACIALNYFYDNNPEMALMYYRRILSLGVHSPDLYCNIALCCLYSGQIDLVLPCFQRALLTSKNSEQKASIWYNISFVAITIGDFNLARRSLQLCLTSDARNGAALNNLAVLSAHTGDLLKAKSYLTAAKEVLIDSVEIENNIKYMEEHYKL